MVSAKSGISQTQLKECFEVMTECLSDLLADGDDLCVNNFGTLYCKMLPERAARNPLTEEQIVVPERIVVKFKMSKQLKEKINTKKMEISE